ncbi:MAG: alpha-ketoacid dehydrogenase subunit beta [Actinobacteria bacterium]|nr:alpha-ketoacid dehydrogenase subunit beta [Actinomycetota bacterium]
MSPTSTAKRLTPAMADAIAQEMRSDPTVYLWGVDVTVGVMGPTRGLAKEFGPDKIRDCPISEAGFVGAAVGAAIGGLRPIVDIMFSSFTYVAFDQIVNQAGRIRYMTGGQLSVPMVIIGSAGAAGANAAQHSEVPSALFMNAGGLRVAFPSTAHQAFWLMRSAIRSDDPVVFLFHPALASARGEVRDEPLHLGDAEIGPEGTDLSILATGMMATRARAAAAVLAERGIWAEVVDVCSLSPLPWDAILKSVRKTGRVLAVEEARLTCSAASELAAGITERAWADLKAPVKRLAVPDTPIPFAPTLEESLIPSEEDIVKAAEEVASA